MQKWGGVIEKSSPEKFDFHREDIILKPYIPSNIKVFVLSKTGSKPMYNILNKQQVKSVGEKKWDQYFSITQNQWKLIHSLPFSTTKNTKLQWFQFRVNQHILTTNSFMFKINRLNSNMCIFCKAEEETIYHLLWDCPNVQQLLLEFINLCNSKSIFIKLDPMTFIFGELNKSDLAKSFNVILMSIKYYIYKMKCIENNLSIQGLLNELRYLLRALKHSAQESKSVDFNANWKKWFFLMDND